MLKKSLLVVIGLTVIFFALPCLAQGETNVSSEKEIEKKEEKIMTLKDADAGIIINVKDVIGRINSYIYGYFTENLANIIKGGIWAEMLQNRKFESFFAWKSIGEEKSVEYTHDAEVSYSGKYSQKITISANDEKIRGIAQSGISVVKGRDYIATLHLKQKNFNGKIIIALGNNEKELYAMQTIDNCSSEWKRYALTLTPDKTASSCKFMIILEGIGTLWIDSVSLMPAENLNGLREDVIALTREVNPTVIRWPGGCFADGYHWQDGIGPRDQRPARRDPAWKAWEENDFGTDEFIQFCKAVGAEPYLCLNFGSGTVEEAVKWNRYCNSSPSTLEGSWRADNGYPEPYQIQFWGVGNEVCFPTEIGHTDAKSYAEKLIEYSQALKKTDPKVKIVAVGCLASWPGDALTESGAPLPEDIKKFLESLTDWNDIVLKVAGKHIDFLSVHWYIPQLSVEERRGLGKDRLYHTIVAAPQDLERMLRETQATIDKVLKGEKEVKIIIDEWNIMGIARFRLRDALYAAGVLNVMQREDIFMANLASLVNVMGLIIVDQTQANPSSLYSVFKNYTEHSGVLSVRAKVESPCFDLPRTGAVPSLKDVPYLDCSASLSEDKKKLYIHVINRHPSKNLTCDMHLPGCSPKEKVKVWEINAPDILSDVVGISEYAIKGITKDFKYTFPAHSITSMMIPLD